MNKAIGQNSYFKASILKTFDKKLDQSFLFIDKAKKYRSIKRSIYVTNLYPSDFRYNLS